MDVKKGEGEGSGERVSLTAETCLLGVVPDKFEAFGLVLYNISGDGWVVGHLFDEESGTATAVLVGPIAVEKSRIRLRG